jgi:hypothetical protein
VTVIEDLAFRNNSLSSLTLGKNLKTIGDYAFMRNYLTNVDIPSGVKVGKGAFLDNSIILIKIGSNVEISDDRSMGDYGKSFLSFYEGKGKKAGLYRYESGAWKLYVAG